MSIISRKSIIITASLSAIYWFTPEIKDSIKNIFSFTRDLFLVSISVNKQERRIWYAINKELESCLSDYRVLSVTDDKGNITFEPTKGMHYVKLDFGNGLEWSIVDISSDTITLYSSCSIDNMKKYLNKLVNKYYESSCSYVAYSSSNSGSWMKLSFRKIVFDNISMSESMKRTVSLVDDFNNSINLYRNNSRAHKICIVMSGQSHSEKKTVTEYIAKKYLMSIYSLQLVGETESSIISLCQTIPKRSILFIENIDEQLNTVSTSLNPMLSIQGITRAIDGIPPLPESTIVFITCFNWTRNTSNIDHIILFTKN